MEKVRGDFLTLYKREEPQPPGLPLATHSDQVQMNGKIPSEAEVEAAVRCILRMWSECLMCLVDIVQNIWRTGEIPQELGCNVLFLIPKGTTYKRVIRLLETL